MTTGALFAACPPGLEPRLVDEMRALGLAEIAQTPGGATFQGGLDDAMRAALHLRGAARILLRLGEAPIRQLSQLDKWARRLDWGAFLRPGQRVTVEAVCRRSKIYHSGAAAERVAAAARAALGPPGDAAPAVQALVRIEKDLCAVSLDVTGAPLHQRGFKQAVGKAPLRESLAALFLRGCGFAGAEPVLDPMCGSGTIPIEAAEIAAGLAPGRGRRFAFEDFAAFDPAAWAALKAEAAAAAGAPAPRFYGRDRDGGAVEASRANAARAGVAPFCRFDQGAVSDLAPPEGGPGLVLVNPPYGARIGETGALKALYGRLGEVLLARFAGWRVGLITSEPVLARASGLPFAPPGPPVPHGGLKIRLYRTAALS